VEEITVDGVDMPVARKQFCIPHFRRRKVAATIRQTKGEVASLLRLSHPHIITLIGCYQEEDRANHLNMYALMHPVGDNGLKTLLDTRGTLAAQTVSVQ
jgi:serine/threonine protein kinase